MVESPSHQITFSLALCALPFGAELSAMGSILGRSAFESGLLNNADRKSEVLVDG